MNLAEDLFYLLASNADTLAQNDLRRKVDSVEERVTAILLGHKEYYSEMSTSFAFADEWRGKRINAVNNRSPTVSGSTRSEEDLERNVLDRAVDNEEQRRLDELEIKEREIRRNADLERDEIALQHCSQGNDRGYLPDEVTEQQRAILEDCTQNIAAKIPEPAMPGRTFAPPPGAYGYIPPFTATSQPPPFPTVPSLELRYHPLLPR